MGNDGYAHHTAWAAAGNAILFYDPKNAGAITESDQVVFTEWDPTASSDMQALRDVFDTNHDGKLDAGDAGFASFKIMVTNADGTTTVETLAQAGITSINLVPTNANVTQVDGSTVTGQTTFTKSDGSTGAAADVTLAYDSDGHVVKQTVTKNSDGSTTIDNKAYNAGGDLASDTSSTTSANGLTRTLVYDDNGDGVTDRKQTIVTTNNAGGSQTETLSDFGDGGTVLSDRYVTTTSADGKTVTISRDLNGGGIVQQTETRAPDPSGSGGSVDTITYVNQDGSSRGKEVVSISADGLTKTTKLDTAGSGTFDLTTSDVTVVAADGSRTETVKDTNSNGSLRDETITTISANGQTKTVKQDQAGSGTFNLTETSATVTNADGSSTTTVSDTSSKGTLLEKLVTTISADGLTKTAALDADGDGKVDQNTSDTTVVNQDGSRTETVKITSNNGTLLSQVVTVKGADGESRTVTTDATGDGKTTQKETISVAANGTSTDDLQNLNADGSLINRTTTTTSADGLTKTVAIDMDGDGKVDQTESDATAHNANGTSTETVSTTNNDGSLVKKVITTTSANDLTKTTQADIDGNGTVDVTTTDATVVNSDGSLTETISAVSNNGTLLTKSVFTTSADKRTLGITTDAGGDGFTSKAETVSVANNGTVTDTTTDSAQNGTKIDQMVVTTSANRLSTTTQTDKNGDGTFDLTKADTTVINADGSRTETVADTVANGSLRDKTVITTSANGLTKTIAHDYDGNGTADLTVKDATVYNADGSTTETVSETNNNGSLRDTTVTTKSANGLSTTVTHDFDGDGTVDLTTTDVTVLNADGSKTETLTHSNVHGQRDQSVATTSADRRTTTIKRSFSGSVNYTETEITKTADNGSTTDTLSIFAAAGALLTSVAVTTSANGMTSTVQTDVNGDGTVDVTTTDATVIGTNGTRTETVTKTGMVGSTTSLISKTVTATTANGLSKTTQTDANGDGTFDTTTTDVTAYATTGIETETVTDKNADGSVRDTTVTTTSADRRTTTATKSWPNSLTGSHTDTIAVQQDGSTVETITAKNYSGTLLGTETVTTSATGLTKTTVFLDGAGKTLDNQSDATVLNNDGSRTETFTDADRGATASKVVTTTSANGLVKSIQTTLTGVGSMNVATSDVTTMNADGSNAETITDKSGSTLLDTLNMTVSANALTKTFSLDENGDGKADVTDTTAFATDGSKSETTVVTNTATGAQQEKDVITTSADGRTTSLQSARNGDTAYDHFETTVINPDNSVTDTSWVTNPTNAPNYRQVRTQTFTPDGGQTIVVTNYGPGGSNDVQDITTVTESANGLSKTSAVQTRGTGTADLTLTDVTVLNANGSKTETIKEIGSFGASLPNGGLMFERVITTSADGTVVTTKIDNDGNGKFEALDQRTTNADGSVTEQVTDFNNLTGIPTPGDGTGPIMGTAADGTSFFDTVKQISVDGLVSTTQQGGVTATTTLLPGANGSYQWVNASATKGTLASASHMVDANKVDTWTSTVGGTSTTVRLDLASETKAIGQADALYRAVLGRSMTDAETQSLPTYIGGNVLNQTQLATALLGSSEFSKKYGPVNDTLFARLYENAFGHLPAASDLSVYLGQKAAQTTTPVAIVLAVAQKMTDEAGGNGLLQLLPGAPTVIPTSVTLIPTADQAMANMGTTYQQFVASFPTPNGALTNAQISQFETLVYGSTTGVTNQQGTNELTATSSDGKTVDQLLYDTNQTINATTSSYKEIVDVGSKNTLQAGTATGVTLAGGASDTLVGGSGTSTLLALGTNETVTTGSGTTTVQASGDGTTVDASAGTSSVLLTGTSSNMTVKNATSKTSIDVSSAGAHLAGTSTNVTIEGSAVVDISGSGNTISTAGGAPTIAVNGNNDKVTADTGAFITVNGTGETITATNANVTLASGASATLNGDGNIATQTGNSTLTMTGESVFIGISGTGNVDNISNGEVVLGYGASATINGSNNVVLNEPKPTTATGTKMAMAETSAASPSSASAGTVTLNGDGDTFTARGGQNVIVGGNSDAVTLSDPTTPASVTKGSQQVSQDTQGDLVLRGFSDASKLTLANGHASIDLGNGDTVLSSGVPGEIDGYDAGASGLHRWERLYDTLSGALKETDNYLYNASNALTEVDRSNGAGVMTEADFYNPSTSAAIGSYHYGSGGVVNEVVDLVNNHDWLRNTSGSYTDKTSGATSQTQPTLNHG